jgi:hypothetical protein
VRDILAAAGWTAADVRDAKLANWIADIIGEDRLVKAQAEVSMKAVEVADRRFTKRLARELRNVLRASEEGR